MRPIEGLQAWGGGVPRASRVYSDFNQSLRCAKASKPEGGKQGRRDRLASFKQRRLLRFVLQYCVQHTLWMSDALRELGIILRSADLVRSRFRAGTQRVLSVLSHDGGAGKRRGISVRFPSA